MNNFWQISFVRLLGTVVAPTRQICAETWKNESAYFWESGLVYLLKTHDHLPTCWPLESLVGARHPTSKIVPYPTQHCAN